MWKKIWLWMCDEDWVVIAIPYVVLLVLVLVAKQWEMLWMLLSFIPVILFWEWVAIRRTGLSISDQYRTWKHKNMVLARTILFAIAAVLFSLIFHFSVNIIAL